jgi:prepilin peptidase CpaA
MTEHSIQLLLGVALTATAVAASIHDVRARRIPGALTLVAMVVALGLRGLGGAGAVAEGAIGLALGFVIGLGFFAAGIWGGGDGKLLMAVGAFLGWERLLVSLLVIGVVGGMLALYESATRGMLLAALRRVGWTMLGLVTLRRVVLAPQSEAPMTVPYGVAISAGAVLTWAWYLGRAS